VADGHEMVWSAKVVFPEPAQWRLLAQFCHAVGRRLSPIVNWSAWLGDVLLAARPRHLRLRSWQQARL